MRTQVNGHDAPWTPEIHEKWTRAIAGLPVVPVLVSNYFTPRPYVDQYNRGSETEGFTYTIEDDGLHVCQISGRSL